LHGISFFVSPFKLIDSWQKTGRSVQLPGYREVLLL